MMPQQTYSTTITFPDMPEFAVRCSTFPAKVFGDVAWPDDEAGARRMVEAFGLTVGVPLPTADDVTNYIYAGMQMRVYDFGTESSALWGDRRRRDTGVAAAVARAAVHGSQIPREQSPIDGPTLAQLVESGYSMTVNLGGEVGETIRMGSGVVVAGKCLFVYYVIRPGLRGFGRGIEDVAEGWGRNVGAGVEHLVLRATRAGRHLLGWRPDELPPTDAE